ncbi:VOC family protein [Colwellia sp. MEBiC06753]
MTNNIFHYAFKVKDLESTRKFYIDIMGCAEGRSTDTWVDFDFYGHQLSAHIGQCDKPLDYCGKVDGVSVPIPHFGCILSPVQFNELAARFSKAGGNQATFQANISKNTQEKAPKNAKVNTQEQVEFLIKPTIRYQGKAGEQQIMFVLDFSGNALEFKCFANNAEVFAS